MSDHYYDFELSSLEDNPGNLSRAYIDSLMGRMSGEEYAEVFRANEAAAESGPDESPSNRA